MKKTLKKIVLLLTVAVILVSTLPIGASAANGDTYKFRYHLAAQSTFTDDQNAALSEIYVTTIDGDPVNLLNKYGLKDYKGIKTVLLKLSLNLRGDTFDSENKSFYISVIYGYYIGERYLGYYCCLFDYESSEILDDIFALGGELSELFI